MAFGKKQKQVQNHALKRLKILYAYRDVKEDKIYYDKQGNEILGKDLKEELEKKYKWLK